MAISVVMPALEMAQETGKLLAWRKKEGERVTKGEPLLEIETDKAVVEVEAPGDGVLAGITGQVGAIIPVGETIAWLVAPGEKPPLQARKSAPQVRAATSSHAQSAAAAAVAVQSSPPAVPQISPKARRLAKELGVDISGIQGTGPDGVITTEDVTAAAAPTGKSTATSQPPCTAAPVEALSAVARLMAERTTQSWTSVPHFFVTREVDAGGLVAAQKKLAPVVQKKDGVQLSITDWLIALVARVLARHPRLNSSWTGSSIQSNPDVNISLAIAVQDGVVAPVIARADFASLAQISTQRRDLAERARTNHLRPADLAGGTFTISNLGMYQVDAFTAIIVPPQAAILAVGAVADRVVAVQGAAGIRPMINLTLCVDHRVADGARAAEFMNDLAEAMREPERWLAPADQ
jgi:pyruvate dehydrogenase E2 component (dihydrolipoamide acetyltransferase)